MILLTASKNLCFSFEKQRFRFVHLIGIEPTHAAPEATALSTELQVHHHYDTPCCSIMQVVFSVLLIIRRIWLFFRFWQSHAHLLNMAFLHLCHFQMSAILQIYRFTLCGHMFQPV